MILLIIILIIKWNSCFLFIIKWINAQMSCSVSRSCPTLATSWNAVHQASLSFTISQSLPKFMFIASVMPSSHLILCHPRLLLPPIFPSIRVFSNELAFCIRLPKYWSFSITPSNEYSESSPATQFESINSSELCLLYGPALKIIHDHWKDSSLDYTDFCWQSDVFAF